MSGCGSNKGHRRLPQVLDLSRVAELRRIEAYPHHLGHRCRSAADRGL